MFERNIRFYIKEEGWWWWWGGGGYNKLVRTQGKGVLQNVRVHIREGRGSFCLQKIAYVLNG